MKKLLTMILMTATISASVTAIAAVNTSTSATMQPELSKLEASSGGRLGVFAINTADNTQIQNRADERFPMDSTMKVMVAAAILKQSMTDADLLQKRVTYTKADIVYWSPMTEQHLKDGMTMSELCAAAISHSDSTAVNLLIKQLGGPAAVTAFARSIGNSAFRLDRMEPDLNTAIPGDPRDTTTPEAMSKSLQTLVLGDALGAPQRELLQTWLKATTTGDARIRAGAPKGWIVGDKTGTGGYGTTNDIGVIWPPHCSPIVLSIYYAQNKKDADKNDAIIASATSTVINQFAKTDACIKNAIAA